MKTFAQALQELQIPFQLAPLQVSTIEELAPFQRVGLLLEVGAGKTVCGTVLAQIWELPTVVVVPPILIPQWLEWLRMVDPGARVESYYGPNRSAAVFGAKWLVTSHAIFRSDLAKLQAYYLKHLHTTIVDEAQALKNVASKLYKAVRDFSLTQPLILMTATPTTKPVDAYSYISLKTPKAYRSIGHFENLHVVSRDFFGAVTEWRDLPGVNKHLMAQSKKLTKEQMFAGQLNPPIYITHSYDLAPAHQALYEKLVEECLLELESSGQKIDGTTPQKLYHLTQQMILGLAYFADDPKARPVALDLLDSVIEETGCLDQSRSKLIVWTYYQRSSRLITEYLNSKFPGVAVAAYGGVNSAASVAAFMNSQSTRILVAQPLSVGMGLNAMKVCWEMVFLEFSTIPMHIRQSIGRVDRMGQEHIPNIRFYVARKTVQQRLLGNLFKNDDDVSVVESNPQTLRQALLGS